MGNVGLNAALSGSFVAAAEHEHLFKFANNSPSFPYRRFSRLEQGKHLQNGILALVDGLGEILMAINILKHDRELASSVHTIATPERYHPVVRLLMPSANVVTPERLAPHTELTYSSDLIFSHFQSGRALKPIQRLPQNSGRKLVGIAWRGGAGEVGKSGEGPRAASLESLLALLPAGDFTYVSLQYNITPEEKQLLSKQAAVKGTNFNVAKDHVNLLKLCSGMSGIVSVEGSSIHIAGQFGIPVLALMPPVAQFSDGWQWYLDSQFTPPYDRLRPCSREQRAEAISAWLCDIGLL